MERDDVRARDSDSTSGFVWATGHDDAFPERSVVSQQDGCRRFPRDLVLSARTVPGGSSDWKSPVFDGTNHPQRRSHPDGRQSPTHKGFRHVGRDAPQDVPRAQKVHPSGVYSPPQSARIEEYGGPKRVFNATQHVQCVRAPRRRKR